MTTDQDVTDHTDTRPPTHDMQPASPTYMARSSISMPVTARSEGNGHTSSQSVTHSQTAKMTVAAKSQLNRVWGRVRQYPDAIHMRINFTREIQFTRRQQTTGVAQQEMHAEIIQIPSDTLITLPRVLPATLHANRRDRSQCFAATGSRESASFHRE